MDFQYLLKLAASYDARRKKQYWQLLKRLYGGTDRAVKHLRETRDPNIYHGTRAENIPKIMSEGLKKGPFREFGEGVFFGSKDIAELYGDDRLVSKKYNSRLRVVGLDTDNKEAVKEYLARNPDAEISRGALIRLKRPSELKGTKIKYPDVSKAMVFDVSNERPLHRVAPRLTETMIAPAGYKTPAHSPGRLRRKIENELSKLPYEKILELEENFYKSKKIDPKELDRLLSWSRKSPDQGQRLARMLAEDAITPKNPKKLNKLKYYGERSGKRVFDRMNYEFPRHEFFYKQESIGPELLTGSALDAVKKHKAVPENAVVRLSPKEPKLIAQSIQKHKGLSRNAKIGLGAGLSAAAIGTGIALHKRRRKQRERLQKVAYLKELEQW